MEPTYHKSKPIKTINNADGVSRDPSDYRITYIENNIYEGGGAIITPEILNIRVYSCVPPFDSQAYLHIIPNDQVEYPDGHFAKLYRRYESRNWTITEVKQKEKTNEESQIHPQTGKLV